MKPGEQPPKITTAGLRRELRLRDLVLFNICAIVSVRWIAVAAHTGPGSLSLWIVAALFFFLPSAVVVGRLSERFPEEGGMYIWTKRAFGDRHAFLCSWFYFVSNILYLPSLVMAGLGMTAYVFGDVGSRFAENRAIALPVAFGALWAVFLANYFGIKVAKSISALGGSAIFITVAALTAFAIAAALHSGTITHFRLLPSPKKETLNFWAQIAFAFVGLELAPILSGEMRNPRRDIPLAAIISGVACALFYIVGTASMLVLLKPEDINPMTGLAQAGAATARLFHSPALSVLFATLIGIGVGGQLDTWIAGNTRLPYAIGLDHYLPESFARVHPRWGTPHVALFSQALASSLFLLMCGLGETVSGAYQIMVDMTVIATFLPFLYIFGAGFRFASRIAAIFGLGITFLAIGLSLLPPPDAAAATTFELKMLGGLLLFATLGCFIFKRYEAKRLQGDRVIVVP